MFRCIDMQQRSYSALISDVVHDHVGMFGNSDPLVLSQWLNIVNETVKEETLVCVCVLFCLCVCVNIRVCSGALYIRLAMTLNGGRGV